MTNNAIGPLDHVSWTELPHDGSLADFAQRNHLDRDKLTPHGVLILPYNTMLSSERGVDVFPAMTKEVLATLNDNGVTAELYDARARQTLVRKSADILLPILLFAGNAVVSVGLNLLASWIYERYATHRVPGKLRVEYAELGETGRVVRWRRVEGLADQVCALLREEAGTSSLTPGVSHAKNAPPASEEHGRLQAEIASAAANELIREADHLLKTGRADVSEGLYRRALRKLREAMLWAPNECERRAYLHKIGARIHDQFGCTVPLRDGTYSVECPVLLSHARGGFSVGGSAQSTCSICGQDSLTCPHQNGHRYDHVLARRVSSALCNICGEQDCHHVQGTTYDGVRAFSIITEMRIDEVSLVDRPANPLAVIERYTLSASDVSSMLSAHEHDSFVYGTTILACHHCKRCAG